MSKNELPKRIWNLDAETLKEIGVDDESIRAHAEIELDEELDNLEKLSKRKAPIDVTALEEAIRARHRLNWNNFSNA